MIFPSPSDFFFFLNSLFLTWFAPTKLTPRATGKGVDFLKGAAL